MALILFNFIIPPKEIVYFGITNVVVLINRYIYITRYQQLQLIITKLNYLSYQIVFIKIYKMMCLIYSSLFNNAIVLLLVTITFKTAVRHFRCI
ncbi:hypothetical protein AWJ07_00540 [Shewanella frigidimarina]|uniref:Uncharacterized protein n=1 Tax=Shewanella frigidimarina TaxID=56812 RepID=A0A106C2M4_SHEFR|nr:hypothetical protein AWJ07_00540 [Shewanella frigidimarina]